MRRTGISKHGSLRGNRAATREQDLAPARRQPTFFAPNPNSAVLTVRGTIEQGGDTKGISVSRELPAHRNDQAKAVEQATGIVASMLRADSGVH